MWLDYVKLDTFPWHSVFRKFTSTDRVWHKVIPIPQFNFTLPYSECRGHGTGAINGSETSRLNVSIASMRVIFQLL